MSTTGPSSPASAPPSPAKSPIMKLSPEEFHDSVATTLQKATMKPIPQIDVRLHGVSITVNLAQEAKHRRIGGRILPKCEAQLPSSKNILNNISAMFLPGTITLVLGQPGSGKSSLMKILSGRFQLGRDVKLSGDITYNGIKRDEVMKRLPQLVAYIDQHDRHLPTLTVNETFEFAHECNGGKHLATTEKDRFTKGTPDDNQVALELVEEISRVMPQVIVQQLGLETCQNTVVGNAMLRGVSGGQRKRVTTGEMLFGMKQVLVMDEISTGLDSASTFDIVKTFRSLAKRLNKTIIISLLQPSPEVFDLFDDVLILNEGDVIYHGPRDQAVTYFRDMGLICPPRRDVADFLLDIGTREQLQYHESGRDSIPTDPRALADAFCQSSIYRKNFDALNTPVSKALLQNDHEFMDSRKPFRQSIIHNLWALFKRELLVASRNRTFIYSRLFMVVLMGLMNGSTFYDINPAMAQLLMGTLFGTVMFMSMGQISELPTFFAGRDVFYKQRGSNFIRSSTYVISFQLSKIPLSVVEAIVFGTFIYWLCGFVKDAAAYCMFMFLLFLSNMTFASYFFFLSTICKDIHIGKPLSMLSIGIFVVFAGFIVSKDQLPDYFVWIYWLDPIAWAIRALAVNQYRHKTFAGCMFEGQDYCMLTGYDSMGEYALSLFGVPSEKYWVGAAIAYLIGLTCVCMTMSTFTLEYKRYETHSSGGQTVTSTDVYDQIERLSILHNSSKVIPVEQEGEAPIQRKYTVPPVTLAFKDLWYSVLDPAKKKKGDMIDLLKGVTGYAAPGTMTALMGSSGAGKTTLMDVIAGRKTGGKIRGQILLNGHEVTKKVIQRCTGYCEQMDIHCESATVREALTFSAFLRQPAEVSDKDKLATVKEVTDILDLRSLLDKSIHGRSTEQLKRITIAVELCAKPSVLFLDEPTSGLDARSAKSIMEGVRKVAQSGRTIVCTIHQPSTEIFTLFDRLLLLKTGGQTVFHGNLGEDCANLIEYFESLSGTTKIPASYNPATWMLECIGAGVGNTAGLTTDFAALYKESSLSKVVDDDMAKPGVITPLPGSEPISFKHQYAATHATQMKFVVKRFFAMYWRTKSYTLTGLVMAVVLSLLFGGIFTGSEFATYQGVNSAIGIIFLASFFLSAVSFNSAIPIACEERVSFYREQAAQMYHPLWYFMGSTLAELPYVLSRSFVFAAIFYPFVGFRGAEEGTLFGLHLFLMVLMQTYLGQLFAYALPSMEVAALFGVLFNSISGNYMGFNPPAAAIPKGYQWLYYIIPPRYAYANLVAVVFTKCSSPGGSDMGCKPLLNAPLVLGKLTIKEYVEEMFRMRHDQILRNLLVLIGCIVFFRLLALLALRYINHQKR
ncbi:hypothetical protein Poli38472_011162 [Pythium oligandrum]|uniref:ABC transporter domain-containing protein n=1 Tax=Pythium oligandrum TaxID=41045 RepID=A0A8K1CRT3_PYTOL|nr:hypothetical protein Poli38472_011162 [Pythium oligandrum]|eukprot:TMW67542.1 hypothetical protein Poli38472_011162 [Pythium oligandrum]